MIRAYKKKKNELEDVKEKLYIIETEYFTEKQKNILVEEEVTLLRKNIIRLERSLKEI